MMRAISVVVVLGGCLATAYVASGADRTAAQILKEIDAVKVTALDSQKTDKKALASDSQIKSRDAVQKRSRLILELYKIAPDHKRIPALMEERWKTIGTPEKTRYAELLTELDKVIARTKDKHLKIEGAYIRATLRLNPVSSKKTPDPSGVEEFLKLAPKDPRASALLATAANVTRDEKKKAELLERLAKEFPDSDVAQMSSTGPHNQSE